MGSTLRAMVCRPPRVFISSFSYSSSSDLCYQSKAHLRLGVIAFRNPTTVSSRSGGRRAAYYSSLFNPSLDSSELIGRAYQRRTLTRASNWSSERSPYETLELERDADDEKIKVAYRRLAKYYHPDVYNGRGTLEEGETAEARFIKIQAAYELLIDGEKRRQYDREHRLNPMKASQAWMEWLIKKRKAFDQRGDMAIVAWAEQQQREMVLRARLRSRSKIDPEEERMLLAKEKKASIENFSNTIKRHTLVLKRRDLMRKKAEEEKKKVISQLLAAEGLELDPDGDED